MIQQNKVHIPMPPRSIDKLLEQTPSMASMWLAEQDALVEALREAREALEYYRDDQGAGRRRARELLAKWRGAG